jgi:Transposase IS200 like
VRHRVPHVSLLLRDMGFRHEPVVHLPQTVPVCFYYLLFVTEGLHRFYGGRDLHFLTFSCSKRRPYFKSAERCDLLLQILERVRRRYRLVVLGYVVMPEHVHLLVSEPQRAPLSTAIQALKLGVVRSLEGGAIGPMSRQRRET